MVLRSMRAMSWRSPAIASRVRSASGAEMPWPVESCSVTSTSSCLCTSSMSWRTVLALIWPCTASLTASSESRMVRLPIE
ncbi:MAG: hypothetical protein IPM40_17790 [Gammaproteobacteria bacterium]|nr:hypothetical protein [Gammaproteobacteria bacterium]